MFRFIILEGKQYYNPFHLSTSSNSISCYSVVSHNNFNNQNNTNNKNFGYNTSLDIITKRMKIISKQLLINKQENKTKSFEWAIKLKLVSLALADFNNVTN